MKLAARVQGGDGRCLEPAISAITEQTPVELRASESSKEHLYVHALHAQSLRKNELIKCQRSSIVSLPQPVFWCWVLPRNTRLQRGAGAADPARMLRSVLCGALQVLKHGRCIMLTIRWKQLCSRLFRQVDLLGLA